MEFLIFWYHFALSGVLIEISKVTVIIKKFSVELGNRNSSVKNLNISFQYLTFSLKSFFFNWKYITVLFFQLSFLIRHCSFFIFAFRFLFLFVLLFRFANFRCQVFFSFIFSTFVLEAVTVYWQNEVKLKQRPLLFPNKYDFYVDSHLLS